jgi:Ca2+-binding EF-hand superfamily protein
VLDRSAFLRGLELLTKAAGTTLTPELVSLADVLFSLFDSNSNGVVDYDELAGGISVFCAGTTDEKVQAAFALYGTRTIRL